LISLLLRDEGNALIEETRLINNRYVGSTIKTLQAQLVGDLESLSYAIDCSIGEQVVNAVFVQDAPPSHCCPVKTYAKLYCPRAGCNHRSRIE
jgi:hypothetical protein